jgi:hypothetical protein
MAAGRSACPADYYIDRKRPEDAAGARKGFGGERGARRGAVAAAGTITRESPSAAHDKLDSILKDDPKNVQVPVKARWLLGEKQRRSVAAATPPWRPTANRPTPLPARQRRAARNETTEAMAAYNEVSTNPRARHRRSWSWPA